MYIYVCESAGLNVCMCIGVCEYNAFAFVFVCRCRGGGLSARENLIVLLTVLVCECSRRAGDPCGQRLVHTRPVLHEQWPGDERCLG